MKNNLFIRLNAAFLMVVLAANTIIGFACAMGIGMGFNTACHPHRGSAEISNPIKANGKAHIQPNETRNCCDEVNTHNKSENGKDNCCNDKVIQFSQLEKSIPPSPASPTRPVLFTSFISSFYNLEIFFTSVPFRCIKYFVRGHHPPIPDIRVEIRSFQI